MEWGWFLKVHTITIDGSWQDQPLAAMVFQWFFQFWGPMVNNGYWKEAFNNAFFLTKNEIHNKMRVNKDVKNRNKHGMKTENTQVDINQGTSCSRHSIKEIFNFPETVIGLFDICFS